MHKLTSLLLAAGVMLLTAVPLASAQVLLRNGLGKCLNVEGGATISGTRLIGYACDSNDRNEMFFFHADGTIRAFTPDGNLCVDDKGAGGRDDDQIQIWNCNGGLNQRWRYDGRQLLSFNHKCLDLSKGGTWLSFWGNQPAILYRCNGQDNQKWSRLELAQAAPRMSPAPSQPVATPASQLANPAGLSASATNPTLATLVSSAPRPDFTANTGAALRELSATHITQVTPLARLANVTPLKDLSIQAVGDPAIRVQQGFQTSLGRPPGSDEQSAWVNWINMHPQFPATRSSQGIVEMFRAALADPEAGRNLRAAIIQQAFAIRKGRAPSQQELAEWNQKMQANRLVYADVVGSIPSAGGGHEARPGSRATAH